MKFFGAFASPFTQPPPQQRTYRSHFKSSLLGIQTAWTAIGGVDGHWRELEFCDVISRIGYFLVLLPIHVLSTMCALM